MSDPIVTVAAPWFGVALVLLLAVAAVMALAARSLFVMSSALAVVAALASASVLVARSGEAALALAALAGVAPVLLLAGVLLSARAAKPSSRGLWLAAIAAAAGASVFAFLAPELERVAPTIAPIGPIGLWLVALVFVAAIGVAALLGYGERGVLSRARPELEP